MLVLSRKTGERILLGGDIRITVVRVSGGGVRLGIEAPPDISVVREEVVREESPAVQSPVASPQRPKKALANNKAPDAEALVSASSQMINMASP